MSAHAILSPSGAERWLTCTPSARLEQQFPDKAGAAASEGTLAHAVGELILRFWLNIIDVTVYDKALAEFKKHPQYEDALYDHADDYNESKAHTKDAMIFLEQKLNLTDYIEEGFGTGDTVIVADGIMDIVDLKYGKGVQVSANNNKQMMLYALGALREMDYIYDIHTVRMTIYQPRLENYSTFEMSVEDLKKWGEEFVKPRAAMAFAGEGDFAPGNACRFCRAKAVCKANAAFNLELMEHDFKTADLLADHEVAHVLNRADLFTNWLTAVQEYALDQAVNHDKQWPGYKIVEGRSNRKYSNETVVATKLIEAGFKEDVIFNKKLVGITAMEKVVGKKEFNIHLEGLIVKPPGAPTLVPESDKRPAYHSSEAAAKDFALVTD
jgi:hypothetical protein